MKKITVYAIIVCLFVTGYSCIYSTVQAQTIMNLAPSDQFTIPNINGTINFAIDGSYTNAILTNNSWEFANLHLDGMRNLTFGSFKVSAQNSNVTITSYISFNENDEQGQLNYSVAGKGTQTLNFGLGAGRAWEVAIDGVNRQQCDGWSISNDETLTITAAVSYVSIYNSIVPYFTPVASDNEPKPANFESIMLIVIFITIIITATILILRQKRSYNRV